MSGNTRSEDGGGRISVVIIAQDDEARIAAAIVSCKPFADEIVVVDGGSQDGTARVAELLGCKVLRNPWPGYAKQRNYGSAAAAHDWIFFIDTDEVVTDRLAESIRRIKKELADPAKAYAVFRMGDFLGRWLENGEYLVRLYNRAQVRYAESLVHEKPDISGDRVVRLKGTLLHYGFRSVQDHVRRFNVYTDLEAEAARLAGRRFRWGRLLLRPPARFLHKYLLQGLFRKGVPGFAVAVFWAQYEFLVSLKQYERERAESRSKAPDGVPAEESVKEGKAYAIR